MGADRRQRDADDLVGTWVCRGSSRYDAYNFDVRKGNRSNIFVRLFTVDVLVLALSLQHGGITGWWHSTDRQLSLAPRGTYQAGGDRVLFYRVRGSPTLAMISQKYSGADLDGRSQAALVARTVYPDYCARHECSARTVCSTSAACHGGLVLGFQLDVLRAAAEKIPVALARLANTSTVRLLRFRSWRKRVPLERRMQLPSEVGTLTALDRIVAEPGVLLSTVPPEIGKLHSLHRLELTTGVHGQLPTSLGSLQSLTTLKLRESLEGQLPTELCKLRRSLRRLDLGHNSLSGTVPTRFGQLLEIRSLHLNDNWLTGPVPSELGELWKLEALRLDENFLQGTLPESLTKAPLAHFFAATNHFRGTIPFGFGKGGKWASSLFTLSLGYNDLTGTLPDDEEGLWSLTILRLEYNHLRGPLPQWLWMTQKFVINFQGNSLEGSLPESFGENFMQSILMLSASDNRLRGTIPSQLGLLSDLGVLSIGRNRLTGQIPDELGMIKTTHPCLLTLGLDHNELQGTLPASLGRLKRLKQLMIAANNLEGRLPSSLVSLSALELFAVHGNQFWGQLPMLQLRPGAQVTLHGNRFSGELPKVLTHHGKKLSQMSTVLLGNEFMCRSGILDLDGEVPSWVPADEQHPGLYRHSALEVQIALMYLSGLVVYVAAVCVTLSGRRPLGRIRRLLRRPRAANEEAIRLHQTVGTAAAASVVLSAFLAWGYTMKPHYYEDLGYLATYGLTTGNVVNLRWFLLLWVAHIALAVECILTLYGRRRQYEEESATKRPSCKIWCRRKSMKACRWSLWIMLVAVFLGFPSVMSVVAMSYPALLIRASEWMGISAGMMKKAHSLAPGMIVVANKVFVPPAAKLFTRFSGINHGSLQQVGHLCIMWLLPGLVIIFLDEWCMGHWKLFWPACWDPKSFEHSYAVKGIEIISLRHEDVCGLQPKHSLLRRNCTRAIVLKITPMYLKTVIISAIFPQLLALFSWGCCGGRLLEFLESWGYVPLSPHSVVHDLCFWADVAIVAAPFCPLVSLVVLASVVVSYITFVIGSRHYRLLKSTVSECPVRTPLSPLCFACFCAFGLMTWTSWELRQPNHPILILCPLWVALRVLWAWRTARKQVNSAQAEAGDTDWETGGSEEGLELTHRA